MATDKKKLVTYIYGSTFKELQLLLIYEKYQLNKKISISSLLEGIIAEHIKSNQVKIDKARALVEKYTKEYMKQEANKESV